MVNFYRYTNLYTHRCNSFNHIYIAGAIRKVYANGTIKEIDMLQQIQYKYGGCDSHHKYNSSVFYGTLIVWKILQIIFGLHVTLNIVRMEDVSE